MSNRSSLDERTTAPTEASRRGAHRARPKAIPSGLPILAGVAAILLVIGGSYVALHGNATPGTSSVAGADPEDSATPTARATTRASAAASPGAQASATRPAPTSATRRATVVNRGSVRLKVLNSVPVQGLAARGKSNLVAKGWTVASTGNAREKNLTQTKVYYGASTLRATARQVVKDLGFGSIVLNPGVTSGMNLIVVLGADAE